MTSLPRRVFIINGSSYGRMIWIKRYCGSGTIARWPPKGSKPTTTTTTYTLKCLHLQGATKTATVTILPTFQEL
jgi:hypothetical protein